MTAKRLSVLRELAWLCDEAPTWARMDHDGWLPFHVRYWRRDQGLVREGTPDAVQRQLEALAKDGLVAKIRGRAGRTQYTITDAGRKAARDG